MDVKDKVTIAKRILQDNAGYELNDPDYVVSAEVALDSMLEFLEAYASQQMPSEEEVLDEAYKRYFSTDNDGGESLISAFSKGVEWFKSLQQEKEWDDNKVIDFVNWYIKLNKLDFRYTLENKNIIDSFKNGDKPEDWHEQPPQEGLHKIECSECGGIFMSPNPKETKCKGCEEGLKT